MRTTWIAGGLVLVGLCGVWQAAAGEEPATPPVEVFLAEAGEALPGGLPMSNYWIGLSCRPVDPALQAQLNIARGVVVDHVAPESPAAKAGLQQHDVVTKLGETAIGDLPGLVKAVEALQEKETTIEFYRGGKQQSAAITPVKRPAEPAFGFPVPLRPGFAPALPGAPGVPFPPQAGARVFVHPGVVVPDARFPRDLTIQVTKEGDNPAKLTVKQGDKTWEITEKELDKLPAEIRPFAERLLGRGDVLYAFKAAQAQPFKVEVAPPRVPAVPGVPVAPPVQARRIEVRAVELPPAVDSAKLEARLEELHRKVDAILKRLDAGQ